MFCCGFFFFFFFFFFLFFPLVAMALITSCHLHRLAKLKQMKASDELGGEDLRQILMDMETAYADFHKSLSL